MPATENWFVARVTSGWSVDAIHRSLADYTPEELIALLAQNREAVENRKKPWLQTGVAILFYALVTGILVELKRRLVLMMGAVAGIFFQIAGQLVLAIFIRFTYQPFLQSFWSNEFWPLAGRVARDVRSVDAVPHLLALWEKAPRKSADGLRDALIRVLPRVTIADAALFDSIALEQLRGLAADKTNRDLARAAWFALDALADHALTTTLRDVRIYGSADDQAVAAELLRRE